MWKRQLLPLNESIWVLTFHRLFEFSVYIVAITTFFFCWFFFSSYSVWARDVTKLDIIWVHTLSFGFSYLETRSNAVEWKLGLKKTAALRPELHTLKQWHFYCLYELFSFNFSKRLRSSTDTHDSWCPFFLFWSFCPQLDSKVLKSRSGSFMCLLSFSTFRECEGGENVLHDSPSLLCYTTCTDHPFLNHL